MLPPTTDTLNQPDRVPYFAWDLGKTVGEIREILASAERDARDEILVRLLREANSRDVWLFITWADIDEAWERIERRLGRARPVWELMRRRRAQLRELSHDNDDSAEAK